MNHWAQMLADTPALLQRLIARAQRISLPRRCTRDERLRRLRLSLCHAATVRAVYASLEPEVRAAVQALRTQSGGIRADELEQRYGPLRSLSALFADRQPRSVAEQLLLLGWLLPRPAAPYHPPRYLLPPELRRWLPLPAHAQPAILPPPAATLAVRVAAVLLLSAATPGDITLRVDGRLRQPSVELIAQRLGLPADQAAPLCDFVLPLLTQTGLLAVGQHGPILAPAGQSFLGLPAQEQLARLRRAWIGFSGQDRWLMALVRNRRGIDWPLLRRRLIVWAEHTPPDLPLDAALYARLAASLGPLADAQTHGFRMVDRAPWQPQRATAVLVAALRGPLTWLGWYPPATPSADQSSDAWQYAAPGIVLLPPQRLDKQVLRLLPFVETWHYEQNQIAAQITPTSLVRAVSAGQSSDRVWALLDAQAGSLPDEWAALRAVAPVSARLERGAVLRIEPPEVLDAAAQNRSVRRAIASRPAPGVAVVQEGHEAALHRALERQGVALESDPLLPARATDLGILTAGDCAALLLACTFYRRYAPADGPLLLDAVLEERLAAALSPALRRMTRAAIVALDAPAPAAKPAALPHDTAIWPQLPATLPPFSAEPIPVVASAWDSEPEEDAPPVVAVPQQPLSALLSSLRQAIRRRRRVALDYQTAAGVTHYGRIVQPLQLEHHGDEWYLRAYCTLRRDERVFRLDRILQAVICPKRPLNQVVERISGHLPNPNDGNPADGLGVEQGTANAIGTKVDQRPQRAAEFRNLLWAEITFENAILDTDAIALEQLEHLGTSLVLDDIVADEGEHG